MKKIFITLFILAFSGQLLFGQNIRKANHLFEKRAYLAAAELFLNEPVKTKEIYKRLGDCYYFNTNMVEAVKWYKKLISEYNDDVEPTYLYRYAQALKGVNNFLEADSWFVKYRDIIQSMPNGNTATLPYFEDLNNKIKRPYIISNVSVNTKNSDFGPSYYGQTIAFSSPSDTGKLYDWNKQPYLDLFYAEVTDSGDLHNVKPFNTEINTKMHESNAVFTKDGKTMYFTRNNFVDGKKGKDADKISHLKLYRASLVDNEWTSIMELPFNGNNYSIEHPALSPDESQLYFSSDMPGTIGSFDIFVVSIDADGNFGDPKNLGSIINTVQREQFPYMSSTNELYFASDGHFGLGGLDIFKSVLSNDNFSSPVNLSDVINSNKDDFAFIINEELETGYFSSNREGGKGDDDIYSFIQTKIYYVNGVVKNINSGELLPEAVVTLRNENNKIIEEIKVGKDATYSFEIDKNSTYKLVVTRKLYVTSEVEFKTDNEGNISKEIDPMLELYQDVEEAIVVENEKVQIVIEPIYFNFDQWDILPAAALELNNVADIMKKYPKMVIEIGAHTDCRGSDDYNLILSDKRANSVREYLISQGVTVENIQSVGYGETVPLNRCVREGICEDKEYDINRRCEFVIFN